MSWFSTHDPLHVSADVSKRSGMWILQGAQADVKNEGCRVDMRADAGLG